ncbi:MAG: carbon starvation protein A [Planctomycetota bacterium]|nr:carbon starvation protein A [Planctomycetota bacterium]
MYTLLIAIGSFVGFIIAYHTYGRWLARKIFRLDKNAAVPSKELADGVDYVPTRKEVIFGHHFTSIAGTGPIVGPAIAVFWGWLPALIWVVFGSIFIGAVHDFGSLVVSLRNRGQSVGEIAGKVISPRAKILFLLILLLELTIVLAVFGLVIAIIFARYPESVISVWVEIPLALGVGFWVYKKKGGLLWPSLAALAVMYLAIWIGTIVPVDICDWFGIPLLGKTVVNAVVVWTVILFVYCFFASTLPVGTLLQPRDYINSHELFLAMGLILAGLVVASATGQANLFGSAPAIVPASHIPSDAPPIWPFLFITIACGAVSGFHSLVSSGTTSKQIALEPHAQLVGYGSMLLEGALAVIVILVCCAGVGMGAIHRAGEGPGYKYVETVDTNGNQLTGRVAWKARYDHTDVVDKTGRKVGAWSRHGLPQKIGAFIEGGANFLKSIGIPLKIGIGILAVLVASFAATTLDTATRIQRYVIQELSSDIKLKPMTNRYAATALALIVAGAVAIFTGVNPGAGGMILWPMFGALNQLLAGMFFLLLVFYLLKRNRPVWFLIVPLLFMLVMPAWGMLWNMFHPEVGWLAKKNHLLFAFGAAVQVLMVWILIEVVIIWKKARKMIIKKQGVQR